MLRRRTGTCMIPAVSLVLAQPLIVLPYILLPQSGSRRSLTEHLIGKLGYLGIALILILGGLGLPIPEEAPIIVAAVLSRNGTLSWPLAICKLLERRSARRHGGLFPRVSSTARRCSAFRSRAGC